MHWPPLPDNAPPDGESAEAARRLAVYGSLKPGEINAHYLEGIPGRWREGLIPARTVYSGWGLRLGHPALRWCREGEPHPVAVFESDRLPERIGAIDALEGAEYVRRAVFVLVDGVWELTQMYEAAK